MIKAIKKFIVEARGELTKVSWPSKEDVWDSTKVVIVSVIIISIFLGFIDILFSKLIKLVIQ